MSLFTQEHDPIALMENVDYDIEIRKDGYQDYADTITVNDFTEKEIRLIPE